MPRNESRNLALAAALAAALAITPGQSALGADDTDKSGKPEKADERDKTDAGDESPKTDADGRLSANEYFTLAPFVVPVVDDGQHRKQFTLIFAIELEDEDHRDELRRVSARMRNEVYEMLFRLVSFRTMKPRIPSNENLQANLTKVAQRVAGDEIVKTIFVHTANVTEVR